MKLSTRLFLAILSYTAITACSLPTNSSERSTSSQSTSVAKEPMVGDTAPWFDDFETTDIIGIGLSDEALNGLLQGIVTGWKQSPTDFRPFSHYLSNLREEEGPGESVLGFTDNDGTANTERYDLFTGYCGILMDAIASQR